LRSKTPGAFAEILSRAVFLPREMSRRSLEKTMNRRAARFPHGSTPEQIADKIRERMKASAN
jgi:hypothetical protein